MALPEGCIQLDLEDMREIEGGVYISNEAICNILIGCGLNPIGTTLVGLGLHKLAGLITAKAAAIGAKFGATFGGVIGGAVGGLVSAAIGGGAAWTIARAVIEKKGISIEPAFIAGTKIPYYVDISIK